VQLSDPKYDRGKRQLTFNATILEDPTAGLRPDTALYDFIRRHDGKIAKSFGATSVFIDSAPPDASAPRSTWSNCQAADGNNPKQGHYTCRGKLPGDGRGDWFEVKCTELPNGEHFVDGSPVYYQFVQRRPNDAAVITDEPRIDDHGSNVSWTATRTDSVEWQHIGSRLGTALGININPKGSDPGADYTFDVWCTFSEDDAWVVVG
jgi:hypothetical protein